jgi:RNA polymerase sigma-70 factor (ECF subfamily)
VAARHTVEEEFREFVSARSPALLRTAYLLAGDWATAEDLLQTALTKTYLAWKRLGRIEAVEPYARRVLVNTATSWWRRRWHGERPTEVLPERPAPDQFEEQLERDALWRHVRSLPARQRAILVLRFYEDMSEAQAAAMLNISPGTVKSQTSRALATLRRRLGVPIGPAPTTASATPTGAPAGHLDTARSGSGVDPAQPPGGANRQRTTTDRRPASSDRQPVTGQREPGSTGTYASPDELEWPVPARPEPAPAAVTFRIGAESR